MKLTNDKLFECLERILGLPIGADNIHYVQDTGIKKIGKFYMNKDDMLFYECLNQNSDTVFDITKYKRMYLKNTDEYLDGLMGASRGRIKYIQDPGAKLAGALYLDANNYKMYKCLENTDTVSNNTSFIEFNIEKITSNGWVRILQLIGLTEFQKYMTPYNADEGRYIHTINIPEGCRLFRMTISVAEPTHSTISPEVYTLSPSSVNIGDTFWDRRSGNGIAEIGLECVYKIRSIIGFKVVRNTGTLDNQIYDNSITLDVMY